MAALLPAILDAIVPPPATPLLNWYDRHRRAMPWRAKPGERADPYAVWLSEIMLQQTTVAAVVPYFQRFMARFPTIGDLADASLADVLEAWAGLGYYARARNLHACAQSVRDLGTFPRDLAGLRTLPGIGAYTAAAVASIAFETPVVPVDGNVERVTARVFAIATPLPAGRAAILAAAASLGHDPVARARPSDFTQALFDLGATVCTPRSPACVVCPWQGHCRGLSTGEPGRLPVKAARTVRPLRHGAQFLLADLQGRVLLRRRPPSGLLGGMLELPGTTWRDAPWSMADALVHMPQPADWRCAGHARHGFTHFELRLDVYVASVDCIVAPGLRVARADLDGVGLPTVMRRCLSVVFDPEGRPA